MSERSGQDDERDDAADRSRIGADLIIPIGGAAFGAYYILSILDVPWMARFNGYFLVSILGLLIVLLMVRSYLALSAGRARFSLADLAETRETAFLRWGLFGLAVAFTVTLEWLGFTLGILLFLLLSMTLLGVRPWFKVIGIAIMMSGAGYVLFILALGARLPHGPIEVLLAWLI